MSTILVITLVCLLGVCVVVGGRGSAHQGDGFEAPERVESGREFWG